MSAHKNTDRVCVIVTILAVLLTFLFMNGEAFGLSKTVDADSESYESEVRFTENDLDGSWDTTSAVRITLEGDNGTVSGNGAYFLDGNLVIASPGQYVISGYLDDGSIIVDYEQGAKTWILLDGVNISCSDDACIRINQADKVFLTLAGDSENILESGEEYSEEAVQDGTGGVIYSHDDLTINGSGSLTIKAGYKHGIESNDDLVITGGNINITAAADGMHVNDSLEITGADITINAEDDALHCDTEVYIADGTILLESCYEGIEAMNVTIDGGDITIYSSDDGINANGGENESGSGTMGGRMTAADPTAAEPIEADTTAEETIAEETDETQENETVAAEEESPLITINGGTVTVINENGMDADGLDSNGDIVINGGTVIVSMNGNGGNNGLDFGSENGGRCLINGGVVIACAGSSMMETMDSSSEQNILVYVPDEMTPNDSVLIVTDSEDGQIISQKIPVGFSSAIVSSPDLVQGQTYTITIQNSDGSENASEEVTIEGTVTNIGTAGTGMGGMGMHQGGPFQQMGGGSGEGNLEEGTMPQPGEMPPMQGTSDSESGEEGTMPQPGEMPPMQNASDSESGEAGEESQTERSVQAEESSETESSEEGQNFQRGQNHQMGQMGGQMGQMQGGFDQQEEQSGSSQTVTTIKDYGTNTWILFGICVVVLAGGIIFARKY